jgi:hypothetical protein
MEAAYSIQQTADGGFAVAGGRFIEGFGDVYLGKTDGDGNLLWSHTFGGGVDEEAECVRECPDGGFILSGRSNSWCPPGMQDFGDFYFVRTNADGDTLWTRVYNLDLDDDAHHIECTPDGGFIAAGEVHALSTGTRACLMKLDANGDSLWTRFYGTDWATYGYSVKLTEDGGYILAGNTLEPSGSGTNIYVVKTDSAGNELWHRVFGGSMHDDGYDVVQTEDGGYALCGGLYASPEHNTDVYLIRMSATGDSLWAFTYGRDTGLETWGDEGLSIVQDRDGGFIISGKTGANMPDRAYYELLKVDASGQQVWLTVCTAGSDFCDGAWMCPTSDGGFVLAGMRWNTPGSGHIYLARYEGSEPPNRCGPDNALSAACSLAPNYPNPFNPKTGIAFDLPRAAHVNLAVYDILGQQVAQLALGMQSAGHHAVNFDGSSLPTGTYYCRLKAGQYTQTRKMLLLK